MGFLVFYTGNFALKSYATQSSQVFCHVWFRVVKPAEHVVVAFAFSRGDVVYVAHKRKEVINTSLKRAVAFFG